jgi:hypothetical protein
MLRHAGFVVLLSCLALSASGCAVMMLGEGHEGGSASLSDVASQARRDSTTRTKARPPDVGYTVPPAREVVVAAEPESAPGIAPGTEPGVAPVAGVPRPPTRKTHPLFVGLVGGGGALGGQDYDGFTAGGLSVGGYPQPQVRVDGAITFNDVRFTNQGYLGQAFTEAGELNFDVTVRCYLTRDRTFMGIYPLAGLGTGTLFWDYARPVTVTENGAPRTLSDDRINYFSFFGGAGMSLMQTRFLHLGGNLSGGVRFYGRHTGSGLKNDLLKTTGYFKALIELSFRVAKV